MRSEIDTILHIVINIAYLKKHTQMAFGRLARRPIVPQGALQGAPPDLFLYITVVRFIAPPAS